jgi:ATP-dependent DNA ligase
VAFDRQSAPKADPTPRVISAATHSRFWHRTRVNVGRRKGSIFGAETQAKDLQAPLKPLIRKTQPYAKKIAHRGVWVEPSLLAEIEYRAKSAEGKVRHPFFKGIREDL